MNREIKFRAWNKIEKTMYTDAINNCKDSFDMVLKHPQIYEVMQSTGLKDKNGVEIYEGDIVKVKDNVYKNIFVGVVGFRDASFVIKSKVVTHYRWIDYSCEVIGNCFENGDLLNE